MNVIQQLRSMGYDTVPETFYKYINEWRSWYDGNVRSFHNYKVFNGQKKVNCRRYSLNMANKVSSDWANLLMNEKVAITLEGEREQQFIDSVFDNNNFRVKCNEMQELKCALGTCAYVPSVYNVSMDVETGEIYGNGAKIKIEYVTAENIIPLSWDASGVTECAFACNKTINNEKYVYLQIHKLNAQNNYDIENHVYMNTNGEFSEVELSSLPEFERVAPVVHTNSSMKQFVIDKPNLANNVDVSLPMGVPVFANAIDALKGVDVAYDSFVNEFVLGKKRIITQPEAMKNYDTQEPYFDVNDLTFYVVPNGANEGAIINEVDMHLRTAEHSTGIQYMLSALSSKCGFGENYFKFDGGGVATATQVVSENSALFRSCKKHEIVLESVLKELCRIIMHLGNMYMGAGLNEDVEMSIDFDDSIIEDKETEFNRDARMVQMGVMNLYEFRMKYMNEDENTAKEALPKIEDLTNEE